MRGNGTRFADVLSAIDAVNAEDPHLVETGGESLPGEFIYGRRMSETLARMAPNAVECLQIAARGQHIGRWRVPRKSYPAGRAGYLAWRKYQRDCQARRLGELMADCGYGPVEIERVGSLIRKKQLNSDADAQMLEDVICVAFLEHYLPAFMTRVDDEKLAGILAKTWKRMSEHGRKYALQLRLPERVPHLLERGLSALGAVHVQAGANA